MFLTGCIINWCRFVCICSVSLFCYVWYWFDVLYLLIILFFFSTALVLPLAYLFLWFYLILSYFYSFKIILYKIIKGARRSSLFALDYFLKSFSSFIDSILMISTFDVSIFVFKYFFIWFCVFLCSG